MLIDRLKVVGGKKGGGRRDGTWDGRKKAALLLLPVL